MNDKQSDMIHDGRRIVILYSIICSNGYFDTRQIYGYGIVLNITYILIPTKENNLFLLPNCNMFLVAYELQCIKFSYLLFYYFPFCNIDS